MVRVLITHGVCLGGGVDAVPGEIHEVPDHLGRLLFASNQAVQAPEVEDIQVRDPKPQNRDPKTK